MPKLDTSDNPIKGFELVHHHYGLYLHCRATAPRQGPCCTYYRKIKRIIYLEEVMRLAALHRQECDLSIQEATSLRDLPFEIIRKD